MPRPYGGIAHAAPSSADGRKPGCVGPCCNDVMNDGTKNFAAPGNLQAAREIFAMSTLLESNALRRYAG
jgi:hypothetical protein